MDNNAHSYAKLDEFLDQLRKSEELNSDAAADVATALKGQISDNISLEVDPYGHPWPPTKNGKPALQRAMKAISVTAEGTVINFEVTGVEARHHTGSAKGYHGGSKALGGYRRALIPFSKLPGPFKGIIRNVLARRFKNIWRDAA